MGFVTIDNVRDVVLEVVVVILIRERKNEVRRILFSKDYSIEHIHNLILDNYLYYKTENINTYKYIL